MVDVTRGNTTVTFDNPADEEFPGIHTVPGFSAVRGYDMATGLGTADGTALVSELAGRGGSSGTERLRYVATPQGGSPGHTGRASRSR